MRLYLDAAPLIYLVEQVAPFADLLHDRLSQPGTQCVSSALNRMECRVKPLRDGDAALLADYERTFSTGLLEFVSISSAVLDEATVLRAHHRFLKTPDAIHLASASLSGCDIFLTHDHALARCSSGVRVEVMGG